MHQKGLTLIQIMLLLMVAGLIGSYAVDYLIEKRCTSTASAMPCNSRVDKG